MNPTFNNATLFPCGFVAAALVLLHLTIIVPTGEAFSAIATSSTTRATTFSSSRHRRGRPPSSAAMTLGSMRDAGDDLETNGANVKDDLVDDDPGNGDRFVGFDLGTSGARMSVVERKSCGGDAARKWEYEEVHAASLAWDDALRYDDADAWRTAVDSLLLRAGGAVLSRVGAMCVSGTSATCLLVGRGGLRASRPARMYDHDVSSSPHWGKVTELIDRYAPERHTARAPTGSLAKLLTWNEERPLGGDEALRHQSDHVSSWLMREGIDGDGDDDDGSRRAVVSSDWHNCLKLGYDVREREFPPWLHDLLAAAGVPDSASVLPSHVVSPGEPVGAVSPALAAKYGMKGPVAVVGGTTDSNAAFLAAAGTRPEPGTAATSLGSTLALKQLSETFVEDASRGVYSHRFPEFPGGGDGRGGARWLVGGASNVGCAVLRQEGFSNEELEALSAKIDPNEDSPLSYYPLTKRGERFPVADSAKEPVLTPRPDSRGEYLRAILQGIGDVERDGYRALGELGASPPAPAVVWTCGGGSRNDAWTSMRERRLRDAYDEGGGGRGVEVRRAANAEASYGAALLAAASFEG